MTSIEQQHLNVSQCFKQKQNGTMSRFMYMIVGSPLCFLTQLEPYNTKAKACKPHNCHSIQFHFKCIHKCRVFCISLMSKPVVMVERKNILRGQEGETFRGSRLRRTPDLCNILTKVRFRYINKEYMKQQFYH